MKLTSIAKKLFHKQPTVEKIQKAILAKSKDYKKHNALIDMINEASLEELNKSINSNNLIQYAIDASNYEIADFLIEKGVEVNHKNCMNCTPLHYAVHARQLPLSLKLIEYGADSEAVNHFGVTPMVTAEAFMSKQDLATLKKAADEAKKSKNISSPKSGF